MDDYNTPGTSGGTTGRSDNVDGRGMRVVVDEQPGATSFAEEFFSGKFGVVDLNTVISDESFEIVPLDRFVDAVSTKPVEWQSDPATVKPEPHSPLPAADVTNGPHFYPDQRLSMTGPACPPWLHAKQQPAGTISASYPAAESSLLIVTCSPDGGLWPWTTCCTAFLANFVTGGLCFSMFAMDEQHVRYEHALCHLIVFNLTAAIAIPLAGVLVNVYGYRCIMALGSSLLILWLLMVTTGCTALFNTVLGIVGGFGTGAINGTYSVLLSVLFTERRALVHGIVYVGGVAGLMILPPTIRIMSESSSWLCVVVVYTTLTLAIFGFGLLMAVPYPFELKLLDNDNESFGSRQINRHKALRAAYNHRLFSKDYPCIKYPTVNEVIGDRRTRMVLLTEDTPRTKRMPDLRDEDVSNQINDRPKIQNATNYWTQPSPSGVRPLYRDDIHFDGNVKLFFDQTGKQSMFDYHTSVSRLFTVEDLQRKFTGTFDVSQDPARRSLKIAFDVKGIELGTYVFILGTDGLVNFVLCTILGSLTVMSKNLKRPLYEGLTCCTCVGLLLGRFFGLVFWETMPKNVPFHVSFVCLVIGGLSVALHATFDRNEIPLRALTLLGYGIFTELYRCGLKSILCRLIEISRFTQFHTYHTLTRGITSTVSFMWIDSMIQPVADTGSSAFMLCGNALIFSAFILLFGYLYLNRQRTNARLHEYP